MRSAIGIQWRWRLPSFSTFKVVVSQSASDHTSPGATATVAVGRAGSFSGADKKMQSESG